MGRGEEPRLFVCANAVVREGAVPHLRGTPHSLDCGDGSRRFPIAVAAEPRLLWFTP
jgi:hypothetical protein